MQLVFLNACFLGSRLSHQQVNSTPATLWLQPEKQADSFCQPSRPIPSCMTSSRIPRFYDLAVGDRLIQAAQAAGLPAEALSGLAPGGGLTLEQADKMTENVVSVFGLPLGLALNFVVNGEEVLVPMAIEEPSVIAGASFMAKLARAGGGFTAEADLPEMIGQVQLLDVPDMAAATQALAAQRAALLAEVDAIDPVIVELGGGARELIARPIADTPVGPMLIVHLVFDTRDAMGANAVNSAVERLAPRLEAPDGRAGRTCASSPTWLIGAWRAPAAPSQPRRWPSAPTTASVCGRASSRPGLSPPSTPTVQPPTTRAS